MYSLKTNSSTLYQKIKHFIYYPKAKVSAQFIKKSKKFIYILLKVEILTEFLKNLNIFQSFFLKKETLAHLKKLNTETEIPTHFIKKVIFFHTPLETEISVCFIKKSVFFFFNLFKKGILV